MSRNYTRHHYRFEELPWLTSPRRQLELEGVALGLIRIPAGEGYTFTHRHRKQEEVYIVIEGEGILLVNEEELPLVRGDLIRVAAEASRALKAGSTPLFVICCGGVPMGYPENPRARYMIDDGIPDYDDIPPWYRDNPEVMARNQQLKARMKKSQQDQD
jgi:mannose-6-phosphate isomerase-like protein (cupin superfamily)